MNNRTLTGYYMESMENQPDHVIGITHENRDNLIVSASLVDGTWVITSFYGDDIWQISGFCNNTHKSRRRLDFNTIPLSFRKVMKAITYRYIRKGRAGLGRPRGTGISTTIAAAFPFLRYLENRGISNLSEVTPALCVEYIKFCKEIRQVSRNAGKLLKPRALQARFRSVETIFHLSQYTEDPMPAHPWPDTSSSVLAKLPFGYKSTTPLIPDEVFCIMFKEAYQQIESADQLLEIQATVDAYVGRRGGRNMASKKIALKNLGWVWGLNAFRSALIRLRTSCYIVLASTSGCRNHELANLQTGAHHRSEDENGTVYHWMRSLSEKTKAGVHDWMIPEAAVRALRVMERLAAPYQARIATEIEQRRRVNPQDPEIAEALRHRKSLFLGLKANSNQKNFRTLTGLAWNFRLKEFARECGLSWKLNSHQFRRKFANYAAHSRFGDLRYLREHYAHWSMDMTLSYAMDESWGKHLDIDLFAETEKGLQTIKTNVVGKWLSEPNLAGGYGRSLKKWQREPQNLLMFKDHSTMLKAIADSTAIRSNGHAWCTADNDDCVGNTLDRTRCGDCANAVIGKEHASLYKRTYEELKNLQNSTNIGEGGRQRVENLIVRCREVLLSLGFDPEV